MNFLKSSKSVRWLGIALRTVCLVFWLGLIWEFSAQGAADSSRLSWMVSCWLSSVMLGSDAVVAVLGWLELPLVAEPLAEALHFLVRKAAHATEYMILAFILMWWLSAFQPWKRVWPLAFALGVLFAIVDEIHQLFVPGRAGQITDVLIDSCGILCGIGVIFTGRLLLPQKALENTTQC